ncbi:MAG: aldehyde dehydrogenase family protein [Planctomycetota bacterium]
MLKVHNPYSGALIAEIPQETSSAIARKVAATREAQLAWRRVPVTERIAALEPGLAWFREHRDAVAADITAQMGKPLAQAQREVDAMLQRAAHMMSIAEAALKPEPLPEPLPGPGSGQPGVHRRIEHAPLGVVLNLAAWNYPLLIAVNVVVPALLAGNAVLLKHSRRTPLCGDHFARAFGALAVPSLVTPVVADHDTTATLIRDPGVDYVAFTGSVEGGRRVYREASHRFIDAGLELGGADPAYIAADADLETAVAGVVDGACYNAGQSCCAVERVYVHHSRYDEFLSRARQLLDEYVLGDPTEPATTMGPLVASSAVDHVAAQVGAASSRGARVLTGGAPSEDGRFFPPTLLADCEDDDAVMREETFGPVLPSRAVADDEEALRRMNDSSFGLTASVWTTDRSRAERLAAELEAGTVYQNRCDYLDPGLPWTGVKDSGKGSTLSRYGFFHLTRRKSIYLQ